MPSTAARFGPLLRVARLSDFDPKDNGITALRLCLALSVVVSHTVVLGGFGLEPLVAESNGLLSIGFAAVLGFFTLSGFLLGRSRERTGVVAFVRNRALRILPGYWLALVFAGLIAAPIASALTGRALDPGAALGYIGTNLSLFVSGQGGIPPVFDVTNGSLWTLRVEAFGYALLAITPARWLRPVALAELVMLLALWMLGPIYRTDMTALLIAFAAGVVAWQWRGRIPMSLPLMIGVAGLASVAAVNNALPLVALGIGYVALGLASNPIRLERDLSYGVYVLAYPLQLTIAQTVIPTFGPVAMFAATVLVLLPLAYLSWTFLESPVLALRTSRYLGGKAPNVAPQPSGDIGLVATRPGDAA